MSVIEKNTSFLDHFARITVLPFLLDVSDLLMPVAF